MFFGWISFDLPIKICKAGMHELQINTFMGVTIRSLISTLNTWMNLWRILPLWDVHKKPQHIAVILQKTHLNAYLREKCLWLNFDWNVFLIVPYSMINQHWCGWWLGADQAPTPMTTRFTDIYVNRPQSVQKNPIETKGWSFFVLKIFRISAWISDCIHVNSEMLFTCSWPNFNGGLVKLSLK